MTGIVPIQGRSLFIPKQGPQTGGPCRDCAWRKRSKGARRGYAQPAELKLGKPQTEGRTAEGIQNARIMPWASSGWRCRTVWVVAAAPNETIVRWPDYPPHCLPQHVGKLILTFEVRNLLRAQSPTGEQMFEVSQYDHPYIFVTTRRTGETYRFLVEDDGAVKYDQARFDERNARRAAIAYLAQRAVVS